MASKVRISLILFIIYEGGHDKKLLHGIGVKYFILNGFFVKEGGNCASWSKRLFVGSAHVV